MVVRVTQGSSVSVALYSVVAAYRRSGEAWRVRLWWRECPFGLCGSGSASRRRSPIAQLAERVAVNRKVASSNLAGRVPFAPRHRKTLANRLSLRCRVHVDRRDYFYECITHSANWTSLLRELRARSTLLWPAIARLSIKTHFVNTAFPTALCFDPAAFRDGDYKKVSAMTVRG